MNFKIREVLTISNFLSLFRLLLSIPAFYFLKFIDISFNYRLIVVGIILIALATDFLDGYFARKRNEITEFGKIIDPLADKVLVAFIVFQMYLINEIPAFFFYIIILRDVIIFFCGIYLTSKIKRVLPSNLLGKITLVVIGLFILAALLECEYYFKFGYYSLMYLSIGLSFASIIGYGIRAKETLIWYKNESVQEH